MQYERMILSLVDLWVRMRHPKQVWREVLRCRRLPAIADPRTANEKFLWRKAFDHDPRIAMTCDKLATKDYVAEQCPDLKIAKVLWKGTDPRAIPDEVLSGDVVVKASHGCRYNYFVHGGRYDRADLERQARKWMRRTYGRQHGEWGYSQVRRQLFVEEMITEPSGGMVQKEVKLLMFGGQCRLAVLIEDRYSHGEAAVFDGQFNRLDTSSGVGLPVSHSELPPSIVEMRHAARLLSRDFDHMRCDFYDRDGSVWFGEMTAYNLGGQMVYLGCDPASECARTWDIRRSWFLTSPQKGWRRRYAEALKRRLDDRHGLPGISE